MFGSRRHRLLRNEVEESRVYSPRLSVAALGSIGLIRQLHKQLEEFIRLPNEKAALGECVRRRHRPTYSV